MGRAMPTDCTHGVTVDWGDFGPCQDCDEHEGLDCPNIADCEQCESARAVQRTATQHYADLLGAALGAMNHAVLMAATVGSPLAMEYIADWLNDSDAIDEELLPKVEQALAGRQFPPDLKLVES